MCSKCKNKFVEVFIELICLILDKLLWFWCGELSKAHFVSGRMFCHTLLKGHEVEIFWNMQIFEAQS